MQSSKLFYQNGALYAEIRKNERRYFYQNGNIKTFEPYRNGRLHGEVVLFWEGGNMKRRSHFLEGIRHGLDQIWAEGGQLVDEGSYEKGKAVGTHRHWNQKGNLVEEIEYIDSLKSNFRIWDEYGTLIFETVWSGDSYLEKRWDKKSLEWLERRGVLEGKKIVYV